MKEYCPKCGDSRYAKDYPCALCGNPHKDDDDDMDLWELDFDDAVENGLFPMDTEPK